MGTNGKTGHQSHLVAPTAATAMLDPPGIPAAPDAPAGLPPPAVAAQLAAAAAGAEPTPGEHYPQVVEAIHAAQQALQTAAAAGEVDEDAAGLSAAAVKAASLDYLTALPPATLQQLAADNGYIHPALVGLSGAAQHPLVHWLDPAYSQDLPSKAKIQAVAHDRYAALAAGETVGGMTLADLHALEGPPPAPGGAAGWAATPQQFVHAHADLVEAVATFKQANPGYITKPAMVADLIAAENRLAGADCPELAEAATTTKAASRHLVDVALAKVSLSSHVAPAVEKALASGAFSETEAHVLDARQQLALLRHATPAEERHALQQTAAARAEHLAALTATHTTYAGYHAAPSAALSLAGGDPHAVAAFAHDAAAYHQAKAAVGQWINQAAAAGQLKSANMAALQHHPGQLTTQWRAWAKTQQLAGLRAAAAELGLEHPAKATRAQVQNFIAAGWDPDLDKGAVQKAVTAKATAPPAPKPTGPAAAPGTAGVAAPAAGKAGVPATGGRGSWVAGHQQLLAALRHAAASHGDLPARVPDEQVSGWTFGPAQSQSLGGVHTKTVHPAPDGSLWMFKPDTGAGGARAHAEATASRVLAAAGLPSVPVYVTKLGGKTGSIQPLVKGASELTGSPKSWSQADVDAMVRYHVAAWAIGDHDGKTENVLRTPGGGLVPIDQGAAFKHFGNDKLSLSYQPQSTPVFHLAYQAHKGGGLAPGVTINPAAAHPVLRTFESMPDAEWRSLLHTTAYEGAANGVHWTTAMRARAATRHKLPEAKLSTAQIAEEFLDAAVARKQSLRQAFAGFFTTELGLPNALQHS